ncbi:MAG: sulfatase [Chloroflexota bacterium]
MTDRGSGMAKADRRRLLASGAGAFSAALAGRFGTDARGGKQNPPVVPEPEPDKRPNIVLIITDDMRGTDWRALRRTRKALRASTWYRNFIVDASLCSPSRASILTGQYTHNHGVEWNNSGEFEGGFSVYQKNGLDRESLGLVMHDAGYHTGMGGKFMNGLRPGMRQPAGWDRFAASYTTDFYNFPLLVDGQQVNFKGVTKYKTDVLTDYAVEFIEQAPVEQPIFLHFSPTGPHVPETPARRHESAFPTAYVARDESFNEADVSDKPSTVQALPPLTPDQQADLDNHERNRLRSMLAVDEGIVRVVNALKAAKRFDNTYIFILSDNGYQLGQHRVIGKASPYDQSIRVPMLAYGPKVPQRTNNQLVGNIDLAPTIASLGETTMPKQDGKSLLVPGRRDYLFLQLRYIGMGLRSARLMYFEYGNGEREYYDLRNDPLELNNLLPPGSEEDPDPPQGLPRASELALRLSYLRRCSGPRCL